MDLLQHEDNLQPIERKPQRNEKRKWESEGVAAGEKKIKSDYLEHESKGKPKRILDTCALG